MAIVPLGTINPFPMIEAIRSCNSMTVGPTEDTSPLAEAIASRIASWVIVSLADRPGPMDAKHPVEEKRYLIVFLKETFIGGPAWT